MLVGAALRKNWKVSHVCTVRCRIQAARWPPPVLCLPPPSEEEALSPHVTFQNTRHACTTLTIYLCCSPFRVQAKGGDFSTGFPGTSHSGSRPSPGPADLESIEKAKVLEEARLRVLVSAELEIRSWRVITTMAFVSKCQAPISVLRL